MLFFNNPSKVWSGRYTQNIKMDFTVVRGLTSYHCGPSSNAGVNSMCGFVVGSCATCSQLRVFHGYSLDKVLPYLEHTNTFQQVLKNSLVLCG